MDKIWLDSYPPGVPADIDQPLPRSLVALLEESVARHGVRPAFSNMGATLSYADLDRLSRSFAAWLQQVAGLRPGERIALMMPNVLQYPVALFAALRAGLTVVNTNPLYTPRELQHQLEDSGARAVVVLDNFAHTLAQVPSARHLRAVVTTGLGDLLGFPRALLVNAVVKHLKRMVPAYTLPGAVRFGTVLARGRRQQLQNVALGAEDLAFIQYTGGTTGTARGAMLTHGNLLANVEQARLWFQGLLEEGRECVVTALPLYHVFALLANCLLFLRLGGRNILITNPRDLPAFVKTLDGSGFTAISGVNTLFNALLNTPGFDRLDFSRLKLALGGGMAVQRAVAARWKHITGVPLLEAYGLTEASPAIAVSPPTAREFSGTVGLPLPGTEVVICNDAGVEQAPDQPGELCVRGPQVMRGYWCAEQATREVLSAEGWLRTGDVATVDKAGYVRIVERKKDVIVVSGFNVYPSEIEQVISAHPGVAEVGAIGVPDAQTGEAVKVVVVARDPALDARQLLDYCREHLTRYKLPRVVEFRKSLPKTAVGKTLRRALREPGVP